MKIETNFISELLLSLSSDIFTQSFVIVIVEIILTNRTQEISLKNSVQWFEQTHFLPVAIVKHT
jgi:hypothetical protein